MSSLISHLGTLGINQISRSPVLKYLMIMFEVFLLESRLAISVKAENEGQASVQFHQSKMFRY